jgi:hypothetical protein
MTTPIGKEETDKWIDLYEIPRSHRRKYRLAMSGKSRKAAVDAHCLHCMGWDEGAMEAVKKCNTYGCPLWPYRPYQGK